MPGPIIVLGPSEWLKDDNKRALDRSPLETRREIAAAMDPVSSAFVLEGQRQREGEAHIAFFLRILKERDVAKFAVFWPYGGRLHGLGIEAGHLLSEIAHERLSPESVVLLAEKRVLRIDAEKGAFVFDEKGNRTRYYEDFVSYGCPIRRWTTKPSLMTLARAVALEHAYRA